MFDDVMQCLFDYQKEVLPNCRREGSGRNQFRSGELTVETCVTEILYAVTAEVTNKIVQRVVLRVHRPDDLAHIVDELGCPLRNLIDMLRCFFRLPLRELAEDRDL